MAWPSFFSLGRLKRNNPGPHSTAGDGHIQLQTPNMGISGGPGLKQTAVLSREDIEHRLGLLCATSPSTQGENVPHAKIQKIQALLHIVDRMSGRSHVNAWSQRPRIYAILRRINFLEFMDAFVENDFNDFHLPFNEYTLPAFAPTASSHKFRQLFFREQMQYASQLKDIEMENGRHLTIQGNGDVHFHSLRYLGRGGFGQVDKVQSTISFREYARKRVPRGRNSPKDRESQKYIIEELKHLKQLQHEHLVHILGSYTDDSYIAYIMLPVADYDLHGFLSNRRELSANEASMLREFYGCLAGAVHFLHKNHVRHRDLSSKNILISKGKAYVSDFGSAYNYSNRTNSATRHRSIPMNPEYMAPEIAFSQERGTASDLWSLGVIFLEITTRLRGRPLRELREAIILHAKQKGNQSDPYLYHNTPVITSWLKTLRHSDSENLNDVDNEPLGWIADLLVANPKKRSTATLLVKDILESPSCQKFCCVKCESVFDDGDFKFDSLMTRTSGLEDTQELIDSISAAFSLADRSQAFGGSISKQQSSVERWMGEVIPKAAEYTPIPEDVVQTSLFVIQETYTQEDRSSQDYTDPKDDAEQVFSDIGRVPGLAFENIQSETETRGQYASPRMPGSWPGEDYEEYQGWPIPLKAEDTLSSKSEVAVDSITETLLSDDEKLFDEISDVEATDTESSIMEPLDDLDCEDKTLGVKSLNIHNASISKLNSEALFIEVSSDDSNDEGVSRPKQRLAAQKDKELQRKAKEFLDTVVDHEDQESPIPETAKFEREIPSQSFGSTTKVQEAKQAQTKSEEAVHVVADEIPVTREDPSATAPSNTEEVADEELLYRGHRSQVTKWLMEKKIVAQKQEPQRLEWKQTRRDGTIAEADAQVPEVVVVTSATFGNTGDITNEIPVLNLSPKTPVLSSMRRKTKNVTFEQVPKIPEAVANEPIDDKQMGTISSDSALRTNDEKENTTGRSNTTEGQDDWGCNKMPVMEEEQMRMPSDAAYQPQIPEVRVEEIYDDASGTIHAPLSAANLQKLKKIEDPVSNFGKLKLESYIRDTWESASSTPTSVISHNLREKLERSMLPIKSLNHSYDFLSQYCKEGRPGAVKYLISQGCNPGTKKKPFSTPIFNATRGGTDKHFKCVRILIDAGARVNVTKKSSGKMPLHYAIEHDLYKKYAKLIWLLVNAGAKLNVADANGEYPITKLFTGKNSNPLGEHHLRALAILLHKGAKVGVELQGTGNTPLHLATRRQDPLAVAMILFKGASTKLLNYAGMTPLLITANQFHGNLSKNYKQVLELLLEADKTSDMKDPNSKSVIDSQGGVNKRTALHLAKLSGTEEAVEILLKYGASLDVEDAKGVKARDAKAR